LNHFNLAYKLHIQPDLELCQTGYSNYSKASISKSLANGVGILDFWQKRLKHPSNSLANDMAKYDNLAKKPPSPRIFGNLANGLVNPLSACMLRTDHENKVFSLLACCLLPFFSFRQVRNSKLLKRNCFFTWQIVLELPNHKICQIEHDKLLEMLS